MTSVPPDRVGQAVERFFDTKAATIEPKAAMHRALGPWLVVFQAYPDPAAFAEAVAQRARSTTEWDIVTGKISPDGASILAALLRQKEEKP